jgi:hypothetical protein
MNPAKVPIEEDEIVTHPARAAAMKGAKNRLTYAS